MNPDIPSLRKKRIPPPLFKYNLRADPPKRPDFDTAKPAIFLDRDGTLMEEVGYCTKAKHVRVFSNASNSLHRLRKDGYLTIIITNQSGIGRGLILEEDYQKVHNEFLLQVGPELVDWTYFCPDHPDRPTPRRKPCIGMIEEAVRDFHIDLTRSWMIGDKASDIECGKAAGLKTILVATGYGADQECQPDYRVRDVAAAVDWIVVK
ncbi:MAG: HAD family hydrolase [Chthoniobacterales bacterium]